MQAEQLPTNANRHWLGRLTLEFQHRLGKTRLTGVEHFGPLRVQRPFYPEKNDCCHVYLLHPPGGMVSGDELSIEVQLAENASALLTTPSAGKVYRGDSSNDSQRQSVKIIAAENAWIEWLPQETIIFEGARGILDTEIDLGPGAGCFAWDVVCLGRPASKEAFHSGSVTQRLLVTQQGLPVFIERNCFIGGSDFLQHAAGLQGHIVCGTAFCTGQISEELMTSLRDNFDSCFVFTQLEKLFVIRYLGDSAEKCRLGFEKIWQQLRPEARGVDASSPRIWRT